MMTSQPASMPRSGLLPHLLDSTIPPDHPAAMDVLFRRLWSACARWITAPALPYAALWEASSLVLLATKQDDYPPDPVATEMPLLKESWPRD